MRDFCLKYRKNCTLLAHSIDASPTPQVAVWGNALVSTSEVTLRRARLLLGWVTVCGQVSHLAVTHHSCQLSLLPSVGREMSISFRAE